MAGTGDYDRGGGSANDRVLPALPVLPQLANLSAR
jgi:hypothetical protein